MPFQVLSSKSATWHHLSNLTSEDLALMQGRFKFHHLDYEDIRAESPISKMDVYKHYLFFLFHIPTLHKNTGQIYGEAVYVFLGAEDFVTVTHVQIPALEALFDRMSQNPKFRSTSMSRGTAFVMYRVLSVLFRESMQIVGNLTQEVHRLEEAIEHTHNKRLTVDLGHVRRNILFLRHLIDPQRNLLVNVRNIQRPFIPESVLVYVDDLHDMLDTMWISADSLKLILDGLFDMNEALISHKTNEIVTLLTFLSASLMVPTLIAGFYGMNVSWLPFVNHPGIVSALYAIGLLGMLLVVVAVMHFRRN